MTKQQQKLFNIIWNTKPIIKDITKRQTLFKLLNELTNKLMETKVPPHKKSRLVKCNCVFCRYQTLCEYITNEDFPNELKLPRRSPDFSLKFIPKNILSLDISYTLINSLPVHFEQLEYLNLSGTTILNNNISEIASLTNLRLLNVNDCNVKDSVLIQIKNIPLQALWCSNNKLTNTFLNKLQNTPLGNSIEYIDISNNNIKPDGIRVILKFPNLSVILLKGTKIDQRALKTFVSRHDELRYNGMQIERAGYEVTISEYFKVDEQWDIDQFTKTLSSLGMKWFSQEQLYAKSTADSLTFKNY